jgi:lysophospholipase L1-like esterase
MKGLALIASAVALLVGATSAEAKVLKIITPGSQLKLTPGSGYLALGDSVTFGFEEAGVTPPPNYKNASSFVPYPTMLGRELRLTVSNPACPGETSASFLNVKAQSNGCENSLGAPNVGYRRSNPLHVKYSGSQMAYAVSYLRSHPGVRLVSLMIGANDLFLCQKETKDGCTGKGEFQAALAKVKANVKTILSTIRNKAHYGGQLMIVNYYALNYASALIRGESAMLNAGVDSAAKPFKVRFADGFGVWRAATVHSGGSSCVAGLLTQLPAGQCGVHPSYAGQALLAQAVLNATLV